MPPRKRKAPVKSAQIYSSLPMIVHMKSMLNKSFPKKTRDGFTSLELSAKVVKGNIYSDTSTDLLNTSADLLNSSQELIDRLEAWKKQLKEDRVDETHPDEYEDFMKWANILSEKAADDHKVFQYHKANNCSVIDAVKAVSQLPFQYGYDYQELSSKKIIKLSEADLDTPEPILQIRTAGSVIEQIEEDFETEPSLKTKDYQAMRNLLRDYQQAAIPFSKPRAYDKFAKNPTQKDLALLKELQAKALAQVDYFSKEMTQNAASSSPKVMAGLKTLKEKLLEDGKILGLAKPDQPLKETVAACAALDPYYGARDKQVYTISSKPGVPVKAPEKPKAPKPSKAETIENLNAAEVQVKSLVKIIKKAEIPFISNYHFDSMLENTSRLATMLHVSKTVISAGETDTSLSDALVSDCLSKSFNSVDAYLKHKMSDLKENPNRVEDPGKQKYEQPRIRAALHMYEGLVKICKDSNPSYDATRELEAIKGYKDALLSKKSAELFDQETAALYGEKAPKEASQTKAGPTA